ncbi:MAG TPA: hypothetical protein VE860_12020, partial [Chthoniobacterales bacterium]|nr:hypothetical protein [Chthoniobacterales bacterium]
RSCSWLDGFEAFSLCLLAQEFKRIRCSMAWLCADGFPERWIIILRAVYPRGNFPHSHLLGRVGDQQL